MPARALLPLRLFFGLTFVYAGFNKLLDPTFFDASSPASIFGQLASFTHTSPLAPLISVVEPLALPIGLLIALTEIAVGLGAISGLAFRTAALGGAVLSAMFWLTASWTTQPYFYGPDLPYMFGWIALALAGDGGLLVARSVREIGAYVTDDWPGTLRSGTAYRLRGRRAVEVEASPLRRQLLQASLLGAVAVVVSSFAIPLRLLRPDTANATGLGLVGSGTGLTGGGSLGASPAAGNPAASSPAASAGAGGVTGRPTPTPTPKAAGGGIELASISTVDSHGGAVRFRIPNNAPPPIPAGDPGIIVHLSNGKFVAYDATCTHQGCPVSWAPQYGVLLCPCHGAAYDPANHGAVLGGPTRQPLLELPLVVNQQAGTISLKA